MEKRIGLLVGIFIFLLSFSLISAINLDVTSKTISNKIIPEINEPAVFDLTIKNLGDTKEFEIYSIIGIDISPDSKLTIEPGETKTIRINLSPQNSMKSNRGILNFEYRIKDEKDAVQKETLTVNIMGLEDVITITPGNINLKSKQITILLENQANLNFEDVKFKMSSAFFEVQKVISFSQLQKQEIQIDLDQEKLKTSSAGNFLLNTQLEIKGEKTEVESLIKFLEQEDIETTETNKGIIINTHEITKKNLGNTRKDVEITMQKNLISYLFTTINIDPIETKRIGFTREYTWKKELAPNEELKVTVKTNWFYPIIIIILAISLFIFIRKSVETDLILRKNVSFIKTTGGQFALKVSIRAKSKRFLERVNIIDRLPPLVKLYEKFGAIVPDKIDLKNRKLEWNVQVLHPGEEKIFTYIIYSKIGVVGKFELPPTRAIYETNGRVKRAESNRSFFVNEPKIHRSS